MPVTLAEIMADKDHHGINSTMVRDHVLAADGKERLIEELLATRGASYQ